MKYVSTRGSAPELTFDDALLAGLARDGGLYLPASWPQFTNNDIRTLQGLSYADVAIKVMSPFVQGGIWSPGCRATQATGSRPVGYGVIPRSDPGI